MLFIATLGLSLLGVWALERSGVSINHQSLWFMGELFKYGAIGYLFYLFSQLL